MGENKKVIKRKVRDNTIYKFKKKVWSWMFYVIAAKCETNTTWDSTPQYKGRNSWCFKQLGWISRELCCRKKVNPERLHTVQFHLHNILKMINYRNREQIREGRSTMGMITLEDNTKDPWDDRTAVYIHCGRQNYLHMLKMHSIKSTQTK